MRAEAALIALVAACGGAAPPAARPPERPPVGPAATIPPPFVVSRGDLLTATRDQTHLWWISRDAIWRRPLGGPEIGAAERIEYAVGDALVAICADRGRAYVATSSEVVAVDPTGVVEPIAAVSGATDIAVDDRGLYVADGSGILRIAPDGTETRIVDGTAVSALIVADGRLIYVTDKVVFATTDGETRETLPVSITWLSADERGLTMRTVEGDVLIRDLDGVLRLGVWPDGAWRIGAGAVVAAGDWVYVESGDPATGTGAILGLPRAASVPVLLGTGSAYVQDLAARGGRLWWITDDGLIEGDPSTGKSRVLVGGYGLREVEAGRRVVYVAGNAGVDQVDPATGARTNLDGEGRALGVHDPVVAWLSGSTVRVWRDGKRYDLAQLGSTASNAPVVIDDDHLYVPSGAIYRIDETGRIDLVDDGLGQTDRLAVVAAEGGLYVLTTDGVYLVADGATPTRVCTARAGEHLTRLVAGGGWIYATSDRDNLYRIELSGPDPLVLRGANLGPVAADAEAVYVSASTARAIVAVPHDAPALPTLE